MTHVVQLTTEALQDLHELDAFIAEHDSPEKADQVLARIEEIVRSLAQTPERGTNPPELLAFAGRTLREIFFKAYRIVYRVWPDRVSVLLVADGRRDGWTLLERRMLAR